MEQTEKLQWYVLQVYANSELAVKRNIEAEQENGFFTNIKEIFVPIEEITSISPKGKKSILQKALYAGYIYLNIENFDEKQVAALRRLNKVSQLVGLISETEVETMKAKIANTGGKPKYRVSYDKGDMVLIKSGPFANFKGEVDEFEPEKSQLKVQVDIFGRKTDVEISIQEVEAITE